MEISVHSGLGGQTKPFVTIRQSPDLENCHVTRYIFRDYDGSELTVIHFEHKPYPTMGDEVVIP